MTWEPSAVTGSATPCTQANGFCYWSAHPRTLLPIPYRINPAGFPFDPVPSINAAFATWQNDAASSVAFTYVGTTTESQKSSTEGRVWGTWSPPPCAGLTDYLACGGFDTYGSLYIWFNLNKAWANGAVSGKTDLQSVALHEVGHTLGLGHVSDTTQVMYGTMQPATLRRSLNWGDLNGLRYLYPPKSLPAVYEYGYWRFSDSLTTPVYSSLVEFGQSSSSDVPQICDWNGDGIKTVAVYRPGDGSWHIRNRNETGGSNLVFNFGLANDVPVCGDWDNDGVETVGIYRPGDGSWHLRNSNSAGSSHIVLNFGLDGDTAVVGDWDGNGTTTIGVYRPGDGSWHLRNSNSTGTSHMVFNFGLTDDLPVTGDWDGNGTTTIGIYRPADGSWHVRNSNSAGSSHVVSTFGESYSVPMVW